MSCYLIKVENGHKVALRRFFPQILFLIIRDSLCVLYFFLKELKHFRSS